MVEICTFISEKAKSDKERRFCNEIMGLTAVLSKQISILDKDKIHYLNILEKIEEQFAVLKKSKTPSNLIGNAYKKNQLLSSCSQFSRIIQFLTRKLRLQVNFRDM